MSFRSRLLSGLMIWLVAVAWFLAMAQCLWVVPGSTVTQRSNTLFQSDSAHSIRRLTVEELPQELSLDLVHPLIDYTWRPLVATASSALAKIMPRQSASAWACKLLVISIAAFAVAGLGTVAIVQGVPRWHLIMGLFLYLMFSSNVIVVLPEHFGISHGLLALTYSLWQLITSTLVLWISITVLGILTLGTTITNVTLSVALLVAQPFRTRRLRVLGSLGVLALALLLLLGMVKAGFEPRALISEVVGAEGERVSHIVSKFQNNRWTTDPMAAGFYTFSAFTLPVIGPQPHLVDVYNGKFQMLSYEPLAWSDYTLLQMVGVGFWTGLLVVCTVQALRRRESTPAALILLSWILFNIVLHNFWGDEFFLFSPHWSWALVALVLAGIRHVPIKWLVLAFIVIGLAQAQSLWLIRTTLESIL